MKWYIFVYMEKIMFNKSLSAAINNFVSNPIYVSQK